MSKSEELSVPAIFKAAKPYIRRAEELDRSTANPDGPALAYFCRSYAMGKCLKLKGTNSSPEITTFLSSLMGSLESGRNTIVGTSKNEGKPVCENFAFSIFMRAEEEDRSGAITGATAKQFYAAALMFDVCEQFGDLDEEVEQKKKYAKWKAADIIKAMKEGRTPQPGGPGGLDSEVDPFAGLSNEAAQDIPAAPITPPTFIPPPSSYSAPQPHAYQPPSAPAPVPSAAKPVTQYSPPPQQTYGYVPPKTYTSAPRSSNDPRVKDAIEYAEFAVAALKRNDLQLAKDRLHEALRQLEYNN